MTHTITPWIRRVEIGLSRVLPDGTDIAFDTSSLLRTDALTRAKVNMLNVQIGARTPNEVRQIEGLEPYEGGDVFNQSLNGTVTAGGDVASLGTDSDTSIPLMGVIE